jgi:hypothetical protein
MGGRKTPAGAASADFGGAREAETAAHGATVAERQLRRCTGSKRGHAVAVARAASMGARRWCGQRARARGGGAWSSELAGVAAWQGGGAQYYGEGG